MIEHVLIIPDNFPIRIILCPRLYMLVHWISGWLNKVQSMRNQSTKLFMRPSYVDNKHVTNAANILLYAQFKSQMNTIKSHSLQTRF